MKKNKKILTGVLALTLTAAGYLITGCEDPDTGYQAQDTNYTIKYELNGGTNHESNPDSYKPSDKTFSLADASKVGYTFNGWYEEATFKTLVTSIENGERGHKKLYAKFTPIKYTIEYDLDGGILSKNNPTEYNVEATNLVINNPTKAGWTFVGWKDDSTGIIVKYRKIVSGTTGNKSYTAIWTLKDYSITTYSAHGAVDIATSANMNDVVTFDVTPDMGYEIKQIRINGTIYGSTIRQFTMGLEDVEIFIDYELIKYDITYNLDGGTNHESNPSYYTYESNKIELAKPTKEGYTFKGWKNDATNEISSTIVITKNSMGDKSYTAIWGVNTYNINIISEHGDVETLTDDTAEYGETVGFDVVPYRGYRVAAVYINEKLADKYEFVMGDEDATIRVVYELVDYNIIYELDGGENDIKNPETYNLEVGLNLYDPIKEGYSFIGWYTDSTFENEYEYNPESIKDITLYARFAVAQIGENYYQSLEEAITAAKEGENVQLLVDEYVDGAIYLDKNITISGSEGIEIYASDEFASQQLIGIEGATVTFNNITINAREEARVIKVLNGNLVLNNVSITGGKIEGSGSGVYLTGDSTLTMNGGRILNNILVPQNSHLDFGTDLWVGNQSKAIIDGEAQIGNVFIDANASEDVEDGKLTLVSGTINNVYVEYNQDTKSSATFDYKEGSSASNIHLSLLETGKFTTINEPSYGIYTVGVENSME